MSVQLLTVHVGHEAPRLGIERRDRHLLRRHRGARRRLGHAVHERRVAFAPQLQHAARRRLEAPEAREPRERRLERRVAARGDAGDVGAVPAVERHLQRRRRHRRHLAVCRGGSRRRRYGGAGLVRRARIRRRAGAAGAASGAERADLRGDAGDGLGQRALARAQRRLLVQQRHDFLAHRCDGSLHLGRLRALFGAPARLRGRAARAARGGGGGLGGGGGGGGCRIRLLLLRLVVVLLRQKVLLVCAKHDAQRLHLGRRRRQRRQRRERRRAWPQRGRIRRATVASAIHQQRLRLRDEHVVDIFVLLSIMMALLQERVQQLVEVLYIHGYQIIAGAWPSLFDARARHHAD